MMKYSIRLSQFSVFNMIFYPLCSHPRFFDKPLIYTIFFVPQYSERGQSVCLPRKISWPKILHFRGSKQRWGKKQGTKTTQWNYHIFIIFAVSFLKLLWENILLPKPPPTLRFPLYAAIQKTYNNCLFHCFSLGFIL